jgi:hypothetical protein
MLQTVKDAVSSAVSRFWLQGILRTQLAVLLLWMRWCSKQALLLEFIGENMSRSRTFSKSFPTSYSKDPPLHSASPVLTQSLEIADESTESQRRVFSGLSKHFWTAAVLMSECLKSASSFNIEPHVFTAVIQLSVQLLSESGPFLLFFVSL